MTLPIEHIDLHHGRMPADLTFSYGKTHHVSFVIAEIHAGGFVGTGEGIAIGVEGVAHVAQRLIGCDANKLDGLIPPAPMPWTFGESVPREMLSMALFDLVAKATDRPMHQLLGSAQQTTIPLMPCIFATDPKEAAQRAARFSEEGYKHFKVKLFGQLENDVAIIKHVRHAIGNHYLQADLNAAYKDAAVAIEVLHALKDAGLDVIEDVAKLPHDQLALLCDASNRPRLMVDMHNRGQDNLENTIATHCAEVANLHPNCQGTMTEISARALALRASGIAVAVGGTGYTGVGAYGHLHVAAVVADIGQPYGEINGCRDHGMPLCTAVEPIAMHNGHAAIPAGPGHGGAINHQALSSIAHTVTIQ